MTSIERLRTAVSVGSYELGQEPAECSHGFTPKKMAAFIALLAAKAEAKTDAAAACAGAIMRYPMDTNKPHG